MKEIPRKPFSLIVCEVQFDPPFVVLQIIPPLLTAIPLFASVKETSLYPKTGAFCKIQFSPPSVVLSITPLPAIQPLLASVKQIPIK